MITVADIIAVPAFERIELAAPCAGAGAREVRPLRFLYAAKPAAPFLPRPALEMDAGDFCLFVL